MALEYVVDPTPAQRSITAYLREKYPHVPVIPDGMIDAENGDSTPVEERLKFHPDGTVKPFMVLRFGSARRSDRGRSMAFEKLDAHESSVIVAVVSRNGTECRELLNHVGNTLIGWKPENAGGIVKGKQIWEPSIATIDNQNKPQRWASSDRFHFGIQANHTI